MAIDSKTQQQLAKIQNAMRLIADNVKWVEPANIHLTLIFLGYIIVDLVKPVASLMDAVSLRHTASRWAIQGLGYFGKPHPKIIWAGILDTGQALAALQAELNAALQSAGIGGDFKPFQAHLTLGRVRFPLQSKRLSTFITSQKDTRLGQLNGRSLQLIRSQLTSQGPIYSVLHDSPLNQGDTN